MFQDLTSLVVDIGSSRSRIGYGGDDAPKLMPHSYVSSHGQAMHQQGKPKYLVGDKYLSLDRSDNHLDSIFHRCGLEGYEYDFQKLQPFLEYNLLHQMGVDVKDYSVLLSEDVAAKPQQAKQMRQRLAEFMFQRLNVANVFFLKSPVLSCFATGRSTALVIDSGANFTRSVAVHEGFCLYKSTKVVPYGGKHLNKDMKILIQSKIRGTLHSKFELSNKRYTQSFLTFQEEQLINDVKEALSVRRQQESGQTAVNSIEYELPDKQVITVQRKQIRQSLIYGDQTAGFKEAASLVSDTVNSCDVDVKKELYSNILLTGGNILYGSVVEDLLASIGESAPANVKVKPVSVCSPIERKYLSWIGGSIVTSLSSFQSYWVGNQEWKQNGAAILQKKCT